MQRQVVLGFIVEKSTKPHFAIKDIRRTFADLPLLPESYLRLHDWITEFYPAPRGIITQLFLPKSLLQKSQDLHEGSTALPAPALPSPTKDQQHALSAIKAAGSYILHGETGTGKTRVYIELAKRELETGRSSIILTPEISLTSQLTKAFVTAFGENNVMVLHSQLTEAQRRTIWLQLLTRTSPVIVIGPRSALFSPLQSIGLIVVDESHEFTYKQENAPHYHASRVASKMAELHKARVVLGSATPSITDYYLAEQKDRPIIRMTQVASATTINPAKVSLVDMRDKTATTRDPHLSNTLLTHISDALAHKQQVLLFLNRRGTARIVLCDNCGWQALCPHCDLPLTYHHDTHTLRCHSCDFSEPAVSSCPVCHNADITLKSIGTKSIVASVEKLFPNARVKRFDTDSKKGERLNEMYDSIHAGDTDILIGTQMLAKGLDLPKLGLVGVINADASLYIPDFTAQERTFQLLYQIIGRIGRGHQAETTAVIQTYTPDNPTLHAAIKKDWESFYKAEIEERKLFLFPPYCYLLKASVKRASIKSAQKAADKVAEDLYKKGFSVIIEGPAPAFHEKLNDKYVWQLVIKSKQRSELLQVTKALPRDWSFDIDPINLL
jgi:primosomal protein N' (replication factor Y)